MEINYEKLGSRVRSARREKGYTQAQLAEYCGISSVYISHIEQGIAHPSLPILFSIADNLDATPDRFLLDSVQSSTEPITGEIGRLLKKCSSEQLQTVARLIRALLDE